MNPVYHYNVLRVRISSEGNLFRVPLFGVTTVYHLRVGGSLEKFSIWDQKCVEEVPTYFFCKFEPDRSNGLEVRAIFRREYPKSTWHFCDFGKQQTINFIAYWALIGQNYFAANIIRSFQQTRDNQFRVSVWPSRDLKTVFFRADHHFFWRKFRVF